MDGRKAWRRNEKSNVQFFVIVGSSLKGDYSLHELFVGTFKNVELNSDNPMKLSHVAFAGRFSSEDRLIRAMTSWILGCCWRRKELRNINHGNNLFFSMFPFSRHTSVIDGGAVLIDLQCKSSLPSPPLKHLLSYFLHDYSPFE